MNAVDPIPGPLPREREKTESLPRERENGASPRSRRSRSLSEKIAIVRETLLPGVTAAHVARRHQISLNLLYYWRRVYKDIAAAEIEAADAASPDEQQLADLRLQVRNLERLLGQRTLEVAMLREQLEAKR
ncbi:MAG TPA: transposase [Usitatibacter sp.]|nr:transposase [Usitatibacter sp.]